jgi:hypothetical protein
MTYKTPAEILAIAVDAIDAQFGLGYAAKTPELVGRMVQAAALLEIDMTIGDGLTNISYSLDSIAARTA